MSRLIRAVYTVYLLCAGRETTASLLAAELHACVQAGMAGSDAGIVCPRSDVFRMDVSVHPSPAPLLLKVETENGERRRGLIDPGSVCKERGGGRVWETRRWGTRHWVAWLVGRGCLLNTAEWYFVNTSGTCGQVSRKLAFWSSLTSAINARSFFFFKVL